MTNYSDHALVKEGSEIEIKVGYYVDDEPSTIGAMVGYIDEVSDSKTGPSTTYFNLKGRDLSKRLATSSEDATVFQSQQRFYADFSNDDDYEKFMEATTEKSIWFQNGNYYRCETAQQDNFSLAGWYKEKNVWLETKMFFEDAITDAKGGLFWRADADLEDIYCDNYYAFIFDESASRLKLIYSDGGSWTTLAEGAILSWSADTWYYLLVIHINDLCYCYYSTDGITYNRAFPDTVVRGSMTNFSLGYSGIYGFPAGGGYVGFGEVLFRNLDMDVTVEDVGKSIAGMVGVLEITSEATFEDNFDGDGDLDWPHDGAIGTWTESSGRLVATAPNGQWGVIRNNTSFNNFICDFDMELPINRRAGFIYCADTNLQNYYLVEIEQFQGYYDYWQVGRSRVGVNTRVAGLNSSWVRLYRCASGTKTLTKEIRLDHVADILPQNVMLSYRISFQDGFMSLWCNNVLVISDYDDKLSAGYIGFAVYSDDTEVYFDSIRVSALDMAVTQWAVNVAENVGKNLAKLLANETGTYFFDQDGTLVMGRLRPAEGYADVFGTEAPLQIEGEITSAKKISSDMDWVSVYRIDGETVTATVRDEDLLRERGYRFGYKKNKDLLSVEACQDIAQDMIDASKLKINQYDFSHFPDLRIQKRDRVHIVERKTGVEKDFIVDGFSYKFDKSAGFSMGTDLIDPAAS